MTKRKTKKQREFDALRARLIDICNGAGYRWLEEDSYFEAQDDHGVVIHKAASAICWEFGLENNSRINKVYFLDQWGNPDDLTQLVLDALEFDMSE